MADLARPPRAVHGSRRPDARVLVLVDDLDRLAGVVERLGVGGRTAPEAVTIEKLTAARDLRRLATGARP